MTAGAMSVRYSEGYCRIPLAALHRAYDFGAGTIIWRDEEGRVIGGAEVRSRFDDVLRVAFRIAEPSSKGRSAVRRRSSSSGSVRE